MTESATPAMVEGARASGPDPNECRGEEDVGRLHHDPERDIWYECVFDPRKQVLTWTILPPPE